VNDAPSIHPLKPESQASSAPTPLFASEADTFVQQLRLAAQAHRAGRLDEAIASYMRLLTVRPYHAELHNNLGVALRLAGKLEASISHHRLSLSADPANPALHSNLGNALRAANRLDEAVKHHFRSIALNRDYTEGFFNLALCLRDLDRLDDAVGCFGRALALNPGNRRARTELAIALLMRGELETGFAAYETRKRLPETPAPDFSQPAWDGGPIEGKRILLYPEQGLTDVLLFVRFARELRRRGAIVIVLCQALLKDLLQSVDFIDMVVAEGEQLPEFDLHASLVSLPHLCHIDFEARPPEPPYLKPPVDSRIKLGPARQGQAQGRHLLGGHARPAAGSPALGALSALPGAGGRSRTAGVQPAGRRAPEGHPAIWRGRTGARCRPRNLRFRRSRHLRLSQLDLLISIDAPVAHLGAAMGMRTWVLLPTTADWRWQLGGARAPWYPSARLFRQPHAGDWESVFSAVRNELEQLKR
jgi:Tfp pilus assembly protein PilF